MNFTKSLTAFSWKKTVVLLALSLLSNASQAQVVNLGITKTRYFDQTSRTLTSLYDFSISAFIGGTGLNATTPSNDNRFDPPNGGTYPLGFDFGSWYYDEFFPDQNALNAAHANGTYTFRVGAFPPISISLPTNDYPNVPITQSSAGGWIGGQLCVGAPAAARGFHLSTNVSNGSGFLTLEIFDDNEDRIFNQVIQININHDQHLEVDVPPGLIAPGKIYSVEVEFDNVVSATSVPKSTYSWATDPSATAFGIFSTRSFFEIYAVTSPQQQFEVFTARNELPAPQSATTATPFSDGIPNLIKYAFNMNGSRSDVSILIPDTGEGGLPNIDNPNTGTFRFEFLRHVGSGLIYTPQKSGSLQAPSWQNLTSTPTIIPINAEWERVIHDESYSPSVTPQCFGRVQVTLP